MYIINDSWPKKEPLATPTDSATGSKLALSKQVTGQTNSAHYHFKAGDLAWQNARQTGSWGGGGEVKKKYSRKGKLNEKTFMHAN